MTAKKKLLFGWRHEAEVNRTERENQNRAAWTGLKKHQFSFDNAMGRVVLCSIKHVPYFYAVNTVAATIYHASWIFYHI